MKILKYIIIIIIALIVCLVLLSRIFSKMHYKTEVTINAPLQKVFTGYTDFGKMKEWIPGFKKAEYLGGAFMGPGTKKFLSVIPYQNIQYLSKIIHEQVPKQKPSTCLLIQ